MRLAAIALSLSLLLPAAGCEARRERAKEKPPLYLITSLPLLFGEQFGIEFEKPAITKALESEFELKPLDRPGEVPPRATLLMVQPRALPAEELVLLDRWVRSGGRLVLLADPRLEWPSERPLGDPLRPPPMFADTGLLEHWGLRLDAPDKAGPQGIDGVTYVSPGRMTRTGGSCRVAASGVRADCALGQGRATIVADADWIDARQVENADEATRALGEAIDSVRR